MTIHENFVYLHDTEPQDMKSQKLIYYSVDDLYRLYPTVETRGWTAYDFEIWINQDIISGKVSGKKPKLVEIEKESFELFLKYHTTFLKWRTEQVKKGLSSFEKLS